MDIGWFRDLVIAVLAIMFLMVAIAGTLMALFLYKRMKVALDRVETIMKKGAILSSNAQKVLVGPLIQIATLTQGIYQAAIGIVNIFQGKRR